MIVQLGQRSVDGDVDVLLSECHLRIRRFLALARRVAAESASEAQVQDAMAQVARYFSVAFPLHRTDEEELVMPRLLGRDPALDRALSTMHADHVHHEAGVARLVELCAQIEREPYRLDELREALATCSADLAAVLEPHLLLEEREIFPVLRELSRAVRDEIRTAMRARRD
jgi:hemerythrin-like domain-containing protein